MKIDKFLDVIPRPVKTAAWTVSVCCVVAGIAIGLFRSPHPVDTWTALSITQGIGLSLLIAAFMSTWLLCLGFVYADARRRSMPPWLWTLVAAFIPNLLGFLLYFACRKPIALPCPHCGQLNTPGQRFCSWCGQVAYGPLASEGKLA
jgi:hypothetical protein